MYLLVRVKSLMSLKVWSILGLAREKSKSTLSGDFGYLRTKVSIWNCYLEPKFVVFITLVSLDFKKEMGFLLWILRTHLYLLTYQIKKRKQSKPKEQASKRASERASKQASKQATNKLNNQPINQPTKQATNQITNQTTKQTSKQPTKQESINQPTKQIN